MPRELVERRSEFGRRAERRSCGGGARDGREKREREGTEEHSLRDVARVRRTGSECRSASGRRRGRAKCLSRRCYAQAAAHLERIMLSDGRSLEMLFFS